MGSDIAPRDLVLNHLPKHIVERIDPASIKLTKQSFVSPELRELHSDLVASCTIDGKEALLYLVVEHQSTESRLMPLRLIKYKVVAIEDFLQGKPEDTPWPAVLCACFYHGKTSPYPYSTNVYDYFENSSLAQELGGFDRFYLFDLTVIDPKDMQEHGSLGVMEQIFKHSRDQNFFNLLKDLLVMYKDTFLSLERPLRQ
jgi:predicted transposase/invertase (TIGR01784 family)